MLGAHVSDLTVDELKALVRETVEQALTDFLADPDKGLALRDEIKFALQRSAREVREGGAIYSIPDVDRESKEKLAHGNNFSFHAIVKDGLIELPQEYRGKIQQRVQVIARLKGEKKATRTMIDRLLARPVRSKDFRPMSRNEIYDR